MTNPDLIALANELDDIETDAAGKCNWSEVATVSSALRRLASSDGGVKVRALVWPDQCQRGERVHCKPLLDGLEQYCIAHYCGDVGAPVYRWARAHARWSEALYTYDNAKAAAQADYEARIKSALVEVPAVKGEPEPVAWPSDGSCVRCGAVPRTASGLCNTCLDEDAERYENAPPADAGMREALERIQAACNDPVSYGRSYLTDKIAHIAYAALTAPGATTKSDGGQPIHAIKIPEYHYQELDMSGDHHGVTSNYGDYTPVTVRGSTSDPSSTRSEVTALADIAKERQRQRDVEGWTVAHDDGHDAGEMASAAACYALSATGLRGDDGAMLRFWPWDDHWWKPSNHRRDLVKAGALIVAEIERLDRLDQFEIRRK